MNPLLGSSICLSSLNDALKPQSAAYPSFLEYRSIVEMPFLEDQIAKLGAAIRILLHCEGTLRADSYLSPGGVALPCGPMRGFAVFACPRGGSQFGSGPPHRPAG